MKIQHYYIYHFEWEDQRELQGNISYNTGQYLDIARESGCRGQYPDIARESGCRGQYLDIARESGCRGQYPDIARESGFHLSFEPLFDTKL